VVTLPGVPDLWSRTISMKQEPGIGQVVGQKCHCLILPASNRKGISLSLCTTCKFRLIRY
jgi:hypothetical protein